MSEVVESILRKAGLEEAQLRSVKIRKGKREAVFAFLCHAPDDRDLTAQLERELAALLPGFHTVLDFAEPSDLNEAPLPFGEDEYIPEPPPCEQEAYIPEPPPFEPDGYMPEPPPPPEEPFFD